MEFVIWSPPWVESSAGIRVLYKLGNLLRLAGHSVEHSTSPFAYPHQVHVIPDVVWREQIQSAQVVRYCLAPPGIHGSGDADYVNEPLVFTWLQRHYPAGIEFHVPALDADIFTDLKMERSIPRVFHLGRKGHAPVPGAVNISKAHPTGPNSRAKLCAIFNKAVEFYNWDAMSLMNLEAQACGARVFVPAEDGDAQDGHRPLVRTAERRTVAGTEWVEFYDELPKESALEVFLGPIRKMFGS